MKKFLLAGVATALLTGAASAADLPRRAPPPVFTPVPVFTWTGFYVGLHTDYTFTDRENLRTVGLTPGAIGAINAGIRPAVVRSKDVDGFANIGGGGGYNYQFTPGSGVVIGGAFDMVWTDLHKNTVAFGNPNPALANPTLPSVSVFRQSLDYLGTLNGKLGYAFDRVFVYGTGGLAFGNVGYGASFFGNGGANLRDLGGYGVRFETGYNYGGGIEYAIPADSFLNYFSVAKLLGLTSAAATIKAEYIHYDLGSRNITLFNAANVATYGSRAATEGNMVRAGFNYKFGGL